MPVDIIIPPLSAVKNTIDDINANVWYEFTFQGKYTEARGVAMLKYDEIADIHTLIAFDQNSDLILWNDIFESADRYAFEFSVKPLPNRSKFTVTINVDD